MDYVRRWCIRLGWHERCFVMEVLRWCGRSRVRNSVARLHFAGKALYDVIDSERVPCREGAESYVR